MKKRKSVTEQKVPCPKCGKRAKWFARYPDGRQCYECSKCGEIFEIKSGPDEWKLYDKLWIEMTSQEHGCVAVIDRKQVTPVDSASNIVKDGERP